MAEGCCGSYSLVDPVPSRGDTFQCTETYPRLGLVRKRTIPGVSGMVLPGRSFFLGNRRSTSRTDTLSRSFASRVFRLLAPVRLDLVFRHEVLPGPESMTFKLQFKGFVFVISTQVKGSPTTYEGVSTSRWNVSPVPRRWYVWCTSKVFVKRRKVYL